MNFRPLFFRCLKNFFVTLQAVLKIFTNQILFYVLHFVYHRYHNGYFPGGSSIRNSKAAGSTHLQQGKGRTIRVWYSYSWQFLAANACWLLPLCHPLPDVRCGDCLPLPLGSSSKEFRYHGIAEHRLLHAGTCFWPCLRMAERSA